MLKSRVTLKPQQVVVFDAGNVGLAITKERAAKFERVAHRTLVAPAGKYTMQLEGRFGDNGDWVGELKTGAAPLAITEEVSRPVNNEPPDGSPKAVQPDGQPKQQ